MKKLFSVLMIALFVTGCASTDYKMYAETQQKIAQAQAMSDAARYAALADIAKQGDTTAKAVAVMALQLSNGNGHNGHIQNNVAAPKSWADTALQWTQVLLPSVVQAAGIAANQKVAITQSNNQAAIAQSTNATFTAMSNNQAKSNTDIANSGFNAATTIANSGLTAVTTTASNGLTATTNVANAGITGVVTTATNGLTTATNIAKDGNASMVKIVESSNGTIQNLTNTIPLLQPNVTNNTTIFPTPILYPVDPPAGVTAGPTP